jgi:CheY-like chemotaxis protein
MLFPPHVSGVQKLIDVLVVDDDERDRDALAWLLWEHGCVVRAVATAQAARVASLDGVPDVVVTDLRLERGTVSGWVLASALRWEQRTAHVGLIAVTRSVEPSPDVTSPFDAYLRMPVEVSFLTRLVRQLADVSRAAHRGATDAERASRSVGLSGAPSRGSSDVANGSGPCRCCSPRAAQRVPASVDRNPDAHSAGVFVRTGTISRA